jgi:5-methyltetrahydropteroyltriglutamate--homocysteine methyltransferase
MPRIGEGRALKWALERYWRGEINAVELEAAALNVRRRNWQTMAAAGVDVVPSNDFSLYDHVLDAAVMVGAVRARFHPGNGRSPSIAISPWLVAPTSKVSRWRP